MIMTAVGMMKTKKKDEKQTKNIKNQAKEARNE